MDENTEVVVPQVVTHDLADDMEALKRIMAMCWETAEDHGFHTAKLHRDESAHRATSFVERMALVDTETAEAVESWRKNEAPFFTDSHGKPEGYGVEVFDAMIRLFDAVVEYGFDTDWLAAKMMYNDGRPFMHGGKDI